MKPVLDTFGFASVSTISFLSGCTVLAMSAYSIGKTVLAGESEIEYRTATPLAIGAAAGGVIGKQLFTLVKNSSPNPDFVGTVQSAALAAVTLGALLYTVNRARIRPHQLDGAAPAAGIGTILGILSSFLGIGGGPINLPVLHYFFSMETKTAAQNSLYTILFSQAASLVATLVTGTVPGVSASLDGCHGGGGNARRHGRQGAEPAPERRTGYPSFHRAYAGDRRHLSL